LIACARHLHHRRPRQGVTGRVLTLCLWGEIPGQTPTGFLATGTRQARCSTVPSTVTATPRTVTRRRLRAARAEEAVVVVVEMGRRHRCHPPHAATFASTTANRGTIRTVPSTRARGTDTRSTPAPSTHATLPLKTKPPASLVARAGEVRSLPRGFQPNATAHKDQRQRPNPQRHSETLAGPSCVATTATHPTADGVATKACASRVDAQLALRLILASAPTIHQHP